MTSPPGYRPTVKTWLAVLSVALGIFTLMTTELLPVGLLTSIGAAQRISDGVAGLMVTAPGIIAAIAAPLLTIAAGRLDRRLVLCALMTLLALANLVSAAAPNFPTLLAARAVVGLCIGGFWAIAGSLAVRLVPERSVGLATSLIFGGVAAASVLGVPAGTLIGDSSGWRGAFLALGILALAVLVALVMLLPRLPATQAPTPHMLAGQLRNAGIVTGLAVTALLVTGQFTAYTFADPVLQQIAGIEVGRIGGALFLYGVAGVAGNFMAGLSADRNLRRTTTLIIGTLAATMLLFPVLGGGVAEGIAFMGLWGLAYGGVSVTLQTWMIRAAPRATEAATALFVTVFNLSIALGAFVGGLAVDGAGIAGALWLAGSLVLLALGFVGSAGRMTPVASPIAER